jgi:hypothetical protein
MKKKHIKTEAINLTIMYSFYAQSKNTQIFSPSVITTSGPGGKFLCIKYLHITGCLFYRVPAQQLFYSAYDTSTRQQI